jgi:flagellar protein FliL
VLPPKYVNLDPPFVVNFEAEAAVRFLQVTIGIMTRDPETEKLVKENDPRVRNDMLMILSGQSYASLSSNEGKEELRKKCLEAVRVIVKDMHGEPDKVEALYFTSFVMQ